MDIIKPKKNKPKFQTRNKNQEKTSTKNNESKTSKSKFNPSINNNNSNKITFSENATEKEKNNNDDEIKYFEFNAHFKYQDLFSALSALKTLKEENTTNTTKENTKLNSNHNINVTNSSKPLNKKINNNNNIQDFSLKNFCKKKSEVKKGFSRNIEMNNCLKYLEYIEEQKEKSMTFSIVKSYYKENKTLFLPKADILMERIKEKLEKLNHERKVNKISKKKKIVNKNIKNNNKPNNMKECNNLVTISLVNNNISNRNNINNDKNSKLKNLQINLNNPKNLNSKKNINSLNSKIFSISSSRKNHPENRGFKLQLCYNNKKLNISKHISQNNKYLRKASEGVEIKNTKAKSTSVTKSNKKNTIHKTNLKNNQQKINVIKEKFAKQKTLNTKILTSGTYNRIKLNSNNKSTQKKTLEMGSENKNPKMKIVTYNYKNIWKIRNKLNKKITINSFVTSLDKTKENEKSKSRSNLKSSSYNKNKLFKNNYTINTCQKTTPDNNQKDKINNCSLNLNKKKYEMFYSRNKICKNNYVTNNLINTKFHDSQIILHLPKNTITNHSNDVKHNGKQYKAGLNKKLIEKSGTKIFCNNNVDGVINSTCRVAINMKNSFGGKIIDLKKKSKNDKKNIPYSTININNCNIDFNKKNTNNIAIGAKQNKENKDSIKK